MIYIMITSFPYYLLIFFPVLLYIPYIYKYIYIYIYIIYNIYIKYIDIYNCNVSLVILLGKHSVIHLLQQPTLTT